MNLRHSSRPLPHHDSLSPQGSEAFSLENNRKTSDDDDHVMITW
jgi:hypothetical protein